MSLIEKHSEMTMKLQFCADFWKTPTFKNSSRACSCCLGSFSIFIAQLVLTKSIICSVQNSLPTLLGVIVKSVSERDTKSFPEMAKAMKSDLCEISEISVREEWEGACKQDAHISSCNEVTKRANKWICSLTQKKQQHFTHPNTHSNSWIF